MAVAPAVQPDRRPGTASQQQCREDQEASVPDRRYQQRPQNRPDQPAKAGASSNQGKEAFRLLARENVGGDAPGQRDCQKIEDGEPDVKGPGGPEIVRLSGKGGGKPKQVRDEKPIGPWQDRSPGNLRSHPAKEREESHGRHEGAGEKPLQRFRTAGHTHGLAHRAEHKIAGEQQEKHHQTSGHSRSLARFHVEEAGQDSRRTIFMLVSHRRVILAPATGRELRVLWLTRSALNSSPL